MSRAAAALALFAATHQFDGTVITYIRGEASVSGVNAVLGRPTLMVDDGAGPRIEAESHDIIVRAQDLKLSGAPVTPQEGDRLTRLKAGKTYTYELADPPYRPTGDGTLLRLHSNLISVA